VPKITIYSTNNCPYCVSAKEFFKSLGQTFEEVKLDTNPDLRLKLSEENNGWRTVPMIFINDKFYGGFSDITELHKKGELLPLLSKNTKP
jgi:glutaredoxin 3